MTTQPRPPFLSIVGRRFGLGPYGEILTNTKSLTPVQISRPAVDATISVSAEAATTANTRDLSITLKDAFGNTIDYAEMFEIINFSASTMVDWAATGGSTGIGVSTGKLLAMVAKKHFKAITTTAGVWTGTYLDTGSDAGYLGIRLPNGRIIAGGLLTNS